MLDVQWRTPEPPRVSVALGARAPSAPKPASRGPARVVAHLNALLLAPPFPWLRAPIARIRFGSRGRATDARLRHERPRGAHPWAHVPGTRRSTQRGRPWTRRGPGPAAFLFTAPATTEIYTLSLHDALPI